MYDEPAYKVQVRVYPVLFRKLDRRNQMLVGAKKPTRHRTERISARFRSKFSSVRVERRKTIWALTIVWIFVVGGLSMWDDLDGVTERRATLPGPVAVLENF